MKPTPVRNIDARDPSGRVDVLLLRLGEAACRWAERKAFVKLGLRLNLWDGPEGLKSVVETKIDEVGIPREKLTPQLMAEYAGFIKGRRLRQRKTA
jgi:hypothetical protein